jgi:hypothetical protein
MRKVILNLLILTITTAFLACTKEVNNQSGIISKGDLIGYAYLYNDYKVHEIDNSGITISIEGTSISTTTDINGKWELSNLSLGTYTFILAKKNYGTLKIIGRQFVGGGQTYFGASNLYPIPKYYITGINDSLDYAFNNSSDNGTIVVYGTYIQNIPLNYAYFRLFAGTNPDVSSEPTKYGCTIIGSIISNTEIFSNNFYLHLNTKTLNTIGLHSGETVYIIVYADSFNSSAYIDLNTGRNYYPNLNPIHSNILKAMVP